MMNIPEINYALSHLSVELDLNRVDMSCVSVDLLKKLSDFLNTHQLDMETALLNVSRDKALEILMGEIYNILSRYSYWYEANYDFVGFNESKEEARRAYELTEIVWRPFIEEVFPKFIRVKEGGHENSELEDPLGYNRKFGLPGRRYRSIRYDITENPDYPHLTPEVVYERLKRMVGRMPGSGADISRLISLAIKHGLLKRKPHRDSIVRELGMTAKVQSLTKIIDTPEEPISESKRLQSMEEELLRK